VDPILSEIEEARKPEIGDVILSINGYQVDSRGCIDMGDGSVDLLHSWDRAAPGSQMRVKVLRQGEIKDLTWGPTVKRLWLSPPSCQSMEFLIVGGLVFRPFSYDLFAPSPSRGNSTTMLEGLSTGELPPETQLLLDTQPRSFDEEQYVFLARILPHGKYLTKAKT